LCNPQFHQPVWSEWGAIAWDTTVNCGDYYDQSNFAGGEPKQASDASGKHDQIAESMWQSYQQILAERGEMDLESDDDDDNNDNNDN
jgi:hypothetical protein